MSNTTNLDEVRRHALEIVDKSERRWKRAIFMFAAVEGLGWITFIVVAWLAWMSESVDRGRTDPVGAIPSGETG